MPRDVGFAVSKPLLLSPDIQGEEHVSLQH